MNKKKIIITIDSNCINVNGNYKDMNKIEELEKKGIVEIHRTDTMVAEFLYGGSKKGYTKGLKKSKNYPEDIGVAVWDHSRYGHSKWGSKKDSKLFNEIKEILFPNTKELTDKQIKDSMHLRTHLHYGRDYFITDDKKHILSKKNDLRDNLNIIVCTPKEFCENIIDRDN